MKKYATTITPDDQIKGAGQGVLVKHNLGTTDLIVQVFYREAVSNQQVNAAFETRILDENSVRLDFEGMGDPKLVNINNYRVVVIG
jgi:hypothetical protein